MYWAGGLRVVLAAVVAGVVGAVGAQTADVVLTNGLVEPHSVVVDSSGTLYVTDGGGLFSGAHRVMRFVPNTGALSVLAGSLTGERGATNNGLAGAGFNARFYNPAGLVLARGGLVVADSANHTIRYVGFDGVVTNIAGSGDPTLSGPADGTGAAARFNTPLGLAVDAAGNIFVADSKNNAIRRIAPNNAVTTYATGFSQPNGVAVGDNGELWVADTLNHQIKSVATNGTVTVRAGTGAVGGADTFPVAATATLSNPRGVAWISSSSGLLITDTGNHLIRRLYTNTTISAYTLTTALGAAGQAGLANGATNVARFNSPIGVAADVLSGAYVVADSGNLAIRRIQQGVALPPVSTPDIGTVGFRLDADTGELRTFLTPVVDSVFYNDVIIAIRPETGVTTLYAYTNASSDPFDTSFPDLTITPPGYSDGLVSVPTSLSIGTVFTNLVIKAQSSFPGRVSSGVQTARFRFKTATPTITGDNAASFRVNNATTNAQMFYSLDGVTVPTNGANGTTIFGPLTSGTQLSFNLNGSNLTFIVRGFRSGYDSSFTVTNTFSPANFTANRISFGFESGEATSKFIGSAGSIFYAPVTLTTLAAQTMFSLQFGLAVTNGTGNPNSVTPGAVNFFSTLLRQLPDGTFTNLPASFINIQTNLVITNAASVTNLLMVGWLARATTTNFFDTTIQDLIRFSQPHDRRFNSLTDSKVVLGGYGFRVPATATNGQTYRIQISRPSATSDGISQDVFIDAPTTGSLSNGAPINAVKIITVGSPIYLVGDVAPFGWFNAGDFGDTNLLNNDVLQTFQTAILGGNPPLLGSDFFDAMDSCCALGTNTSLPAGVFTNLSLTFTTGLTNGSDTMINRIQFGDGVLNASDVFVTYRRSLDPSLTNFARFRSNGVHYAMITSNSFRGVAGQSLASGTPAVPRTDRVAQSVANPTDIPSVTFSAGEAVAGAGQTLNIPITARVTGPALRVLALRMRVIALDGSPALTVPVQFQAAAALGAPTFSGSQDVSVFGAAWLNDAVAGLSGDAAVGTLIVTLPAGAGADAAYAVRFDHASASPTGIGVVTSRVEPGLISTRVRNFSSWSDVITDAWRLRHFGTLSNLLSAASADADGDGIPNWAEFRAGTDPNDAGSALALRVPGLLAGGARLRWPTAPGKTYILESAPFIGSTNWTAIATNVPGSGRDIEFQAPPPAGPQFFRVRLAEP